MNLKRFCLKSRVCKSACVRIEVLMLFIALVSPSPFNGSHYVRLSLSTSGKLDLEPFPFSKTTLHPFYKCVTLLNIS